MDRQTSVNPRVVTCKEVKVEGGEEKQPVGWRKGSAEHPSHEVTDREGDEMHELRPKGTITGSEALGGFP